MADDGEQMRLPGPIGERKLGEIGLGDPEQPDWLQLRHQVGSSASGGDDLPSATGFGAQLVRSKRNSHSRGTRCTILWFAT